MKQDYDVLKKLKELKVSPWYDNIGRRFIIDGYLKKLFDLGILGVTSNPSIFEKAINYTSDYDMKIADLINKGLDAALIYDELTAWDVTDAALLLKNIYEQSNFLDGYVSIEVPPQYAYDAANTIDYARLICKKINLPNIMIKVPGTEGSDEAIRTLIREGINVNVTLLFGLEHYRSAACAYIEAIKDRLIKGQDVSMVNSVASIFVSRIDTAIDAMLDGLIKELNDPKERLRIESHKGKAAIANAKLIYQAFREIFFCSDFAPLREKGAFSQRVLWASTGTKNALYSDVKYVDGLIAPDTINTMPQDTLDAYLDHGNPCFSIENKAGEATDIIASLSTVGIDIERISQELQDKGVVLFQEAYDKIISSLAAKVGKIIPEKAV